MLVRAVQEENAELPIVVTGNPSIKEGISNTPAAAISQSEMVTAPSEMSHERSVNASAARTSVHAQTNTSAPTAHPINRPPDPVFIFDSMC